MELQGTNDMPPAERQEATFAALLQGLGQRGNGDAHADNIMVGRVPVLNDTKHIHGEILKVLMHIGVDLTLRHLGIAIEVGEGLVHHVEHLLAVLFWPEHLAALQLRTMQVVTLFDHLGHLFEFLGHALLGHKDLILHIVVVLLVAFHLLHQLGVVVVVIDGGHRAQFVEAFDQHSLGIHIGEAQRADNLLHALLTAIILHGGKQGTEHLHVVDEIEPSETDDGPIPLVIITMVHDGSHTTYQLALLVCQKILCLAELKRGILVFAQRVQFVAIQIRGIIRTAFIQVIMKFDEGLELLLARDLLDLYR